MEVVQAGSVGLVLKVRPARLGELPGHGNKACLAPCSVKARHAWHELIELGRGVLHFASDPS